MNEEKKTQLQHEAEGGAAGALAGALIGAVAGPPGVVAGALLGAAVGALAGRAADGGAVADEVENAALDHDIGVSGGELGAPNLAHPPVSTGAYYAQSTGEAPGDDEAPVEDAMPTPRA